MEMLVLRDGGITTWSQIYCGGITLSEQTYVRGDLLGCEHEYKMPFPCYVPVFGFCMKRRYLAVVYVVLCTYR